MHCMGVSMPSFNLAPAGSSAAANKRTVVSQRRIAAGIAGLFALLVLGFLWRHFGAGSSQEPDAGPIILATQRIGQLHAVSKSMKEVLHIDTQTEPEGVIANIPGAHSLYHWATHNQALVVAEGSVEAGIDLSTISEKDVTKTKQSDGTTLLRIHLPPVTVYPPTIHLHVENADSGKFWRDDNIVPKAQEKAERIFTDTAEKDHIRAEAQASILDTLQKLAHTLGSKNIEFHF